VEIPRFIRLMKQGKMKLDGLFTHEFPLDRINLALEAIRTGEAGRVLIKL
jgi:Zn-dependent alcohol dehydrogenase